MKTPLLLYNLLGSSSLPWRLSDEDVDFGTPWCWIYARISSALVLFAGIMSGLTLGLMSLGLIDLEVLQKRRRNRRVSAFFAVELWNLWFLRCSFFVPGSHFSQVLRWIHL